MSNKLEEKVDKILEDITVIKVELAETKVILDRNTESLQEHMRRTEILETKFESDLEPIKKHVAHVEGAGKLLVLGSVLVGIVLGLLELFKRQ